MMLCRATQSPLSLHVLVALGSRLTLDLQFKDFFGVLQEHILSQFYFFLCVSRTLLERRPGYILYEQPPHLGFQAPPLF